MAKNLPCYWSKVRSCNKDLFEDQDKVFIIGSCDSSRKEYIDIIINLVREYNLEPIFAERLDENNNLDAFCENICSNVRGSRLIINDISAPLKTYCEEHGVEDYCPSLNVYWEYGYAAGLGKRQIVICEEEQLKRLPFDVGSKHIQKYTKETLRDCLKPLLELELSKPSIKEELSPEMLEDIYKKFQSWANNKLEENLSLPINKNSRDGLIYDYIFGCIVPYSLSDNLIDFNSNIIKNYIDDYSIIKESQTVKIPDYTRQYEPTNGEDLLIYPSGLIYFCLNYNYSNPADPKFSLGYLKDGTYNILNVRRFQEKYNAPFTTITWGKLESLLEVICFIFNPKCKINLVKIPTENFSFEIIVPNMILNGKRRRLSKSLEFLSHKEYLGDKKDIIIQDSFEYKKIYEFIDSIKKKIIDYYQNPTDRAYI